MKRVWKYALSATSAMQTVLLPHGAEPVAFRTIDDMMFVWCLIDENAELEAAHFVVLYTGTPIPERGAKYVGTTALGAYIFHLFQLTAVDTTPKEKTDGTAV